MPGSFAAALIFLGLGAPFFGWARFSLAGLVVTYALAPLTASTATSLRSGWKLLPVLPAVFARYHFAYGLGFIAGAWDFAVRRTTGRFGGLTRDS